MVYEDPATRDYAIQLCDSLSQKFQDDLEFEFTWWGFKYLSDPEIAQQASQAAAEADLIVVCVHRSGIFPSEVQKWFEAWSSERQLPEGALVVVEVSGQIEDPQASQHQPLKSLAQRANLDYLALPFVTPATSNGTSKAGSHEIENRFEERYHSSGWGINE
jgi:hypothetical protein